MKRLTVIAVWFAVTAGTTVVAYVAVSAADAGVATRPLSTMIASDAGMPENRESGGVASTTTALAASNNGPTRTSSPPIATITTVTSSWRQTTITSEGGLLIVSVRPGDVRLEAVLPHPGFNYQIKDEGLAEVRVEFQSTDLKIEIRADWDQGLVTEIDENA